MNTTLQIHHPNIPKKASLSWVFALVAFFFTTLIHAQLPAFTLDVTPTDESCPGNGTLTFNATGTDPGATVTYRVYFLPNTTTPIAVLTTNFLGGLTAGNYRVIATQVLGTDSNTQTVDVTIANTVITSLYTISGTAVTCGNNGTMTVNTFQGTAASYEIISGPVTAPLQTSNVFTGLSVGVYQVRVFDDCGQGWVVTHSLFASTGTNLSWTESDQAEVMSCNEITITNTLSPELNSAISFPITITYTIHPPGGGPDIVTTTTMASGDISGQEFVTVIPYYSDLVYTYDVTVTDACGNGFYFDNILINKPFLAEFRAPPAECGEYFIALAVDHFMPPLTVEFLQSPPGFDPATYNTSHPGPFSISPINYGDSDNGVPYGHYEVKITDACGRTKTVDATLEYIEPELTIEVTANSGCDSDTSTVVVRVTGYELDYIEIASGPASYSTAYPVDLTAQLDPDTGTLEIEDMPTGTYMIHATDTCGNVYDQEFIVPGLTTQLSTMMWPGCEGGKGSLRIRGADIQLTSVTIIEAPTTFGQTLPYDVSFNISGDFPDTFSMNGFPPGDYKFKVSDSCGLTNEVTITVEGYMITENNYSIIPHCGSFDIDFHFSSNVTSTFWLQRFDPVTGTWGHPQTGVPFNPGDTPGPANSYPLIYSNAINYNISYLGDFRIIQRFQSFENGSVGLFKLCTEIIQQFTFINGLAIVDIQKATCNGVNSDVSVTAVGVAPLTYQITAMNGQPFFVNNGTNHIFANLQPAVYNFQVRDDCGNVTNTLTDVALLPSLVQINQPIDLVECDGDDNNAMADFNLSGQNAAVLGGANPSNFTITYHLSAADATSGINPLPAIYTSISREIFCRMQYNNVSTCFDIVSFQVTVNEYPILDMQLSHTICDGQQITITADPGFESYLWSNGETTQAITVDQPGIYTLEVTQTTNGLTCTATYEVEVILSQPASVHHIETTDWTNNQNTITVILNNQESGNYSYSLDNEHFQSGSTFYGLSPGLYTLYIKDNNGCDPVSQEVHLLSYPKFFTPNTDGYNDFWQVYYANTEPNLKVYIFDRYGKLLTGFGSESKGWDGFYNGKEMPSTDYWFLVIRQDGREHRGHFAMKR